MSSSTFNATVANNIETHDGSSWANVRSASTGNVGSPDGLTVQCKYDGANFYIRRSFMTFDTSAIPDNATITSALLRIKVTANSGNINGGIYVVNNTQASNTSLVGSDYNKVDTTNLGFASDASITGTYDISISVAAVSKTGYTKLALRGLKDFDGNSPSAGTEDYYAQSTDPQLIVTYTTPAVVTTGVASALQPISATLAGEVTDIGGGTVSQRGICWSASVNPTISSSKMVSSGGIGAFTITATGLLPGTLYHFRAYVITENSTQYGADVTFRTPGGAILFNLL